MEASLIFIYCPKESAATVLNYMGDVILESLHFTSLVCQREVRTHWQVIDPASIKNYNYVQDKKMRSMNYANTSAMWPATAVLLYHFLQRSSVN